MKYLDCVEVTVEKEKYSKHGVHKGMHGVIWLEECIDGEWDVFFDLLGDHTPIGDISIREEDLKLIPKIDVSVNEQIKAKFND